MNTKNHQLPIKKYILSFFLSFAITSIILGILSLIFSFFPPKHQWHDFLGSFFSYLPTFICGFLCARVSGRRGLAVGTISAIIYMVLTLGLGAALYKNTYTLYHLIRIFALSALCGAMGGVTGINLK